MCKWKKITLVKLSKGEIEFMILSCSIEPKNKLGLGLRTSVARNSKALRIHIITFISNFCTCQLLSSSCLCIQTSFIASLCHKRLEYVYLSFLCHGEHLSSGLLSWFLPTTSMTVLQLAYLRIGAKFIALTWHQYSPSHQIW
jgi:hypothetical protein